MKKLLLYILVFVGASSVNGTIPVLESEADSVNLELDSSEFREPFKWPFSKKSIWNMPIGKGAAYMDAQIPPISSACFLADEDVIITSPEMKPFPVFYSDAGWSGGDRCQKTGSMLMLNLPIPQDFYVEAPAHTNMAAAILGPDKTTLYQVQPFAHCKGIDYATCNISYPEVDLYGEGIEGAHGGSGLSSIGGTIRLGELVPKGRIRHALKCSLRGAYSLFYSKESKGYRWPASRANDYASDVYGSLGNPVEECRMGALLAIPYWVDIDTLGFQTEPGKILARACQEFGMYIVDDTDTLDAFKICTEWSPEGKVEDEFAITWGYAFSQNGKPEMPWWQDIELLFSHLHVLTNNTIDNVGGGGELLAPEAPDFVQKYMMTLMTDGLIGAEVSPSGPVEVVHGAAVPIEVVSIPAGYTFDQWILTSGEAAIAAPDSASTTVVLKNGDASIIANFNLLPTSMMEVPGGTVDKPPVRVQLVDDSRASRIYFQSEEGVTMSRACIYDMLGALVKGEDMMSDCGEMDISSLPGGIYIIKLQLRGGIFHSQTFIKQ